MSEPPLQPTSEEITRRLRTVAELRNLCLSLGRARRVGEAKGEVDPGKRESSQVESCQWHQ